VCIRDPNGVPLVVPRRRATPSERGQRRPRCV